MEEMNILSQKLVKDDFAFWKKFIQEGKMTEELKLNLSKMTEEQIKEVHLGLIFTEKMHLVMLYVNPKFSHLQMQRIRFAIVGDELSLEQVLLLAKPEFTLEQMDLICQGFKEGLGVELVREYAHPKLTLEGMRMVKRACCEKILLEGLNQN